MHCLRTLKMRLMVRKRREKEKRTCKWLVKKYEKTTSTNQVKIGRKTTFKQTKM